MLVEIVSAAVKVSKPQAGITPLTFVQEKLLNMSYTLQVVFVNWKCRDEVGMMCSIHRRQTNTEVTKMW